MWFYAVIGKIGIEEYKLEWSNYSERQCCKWYLLILWVNGL